MNRGRWSRDETRQGMVVYVLRVDGLHVGQVRALSVGWGWIAWPPIGPQVSGVARSKYAAQRRVRAVLRGGGAE